MELIAIRHTSVAVPPGVCYGQTDVPLRPTFETEAALTLARLKKLLADGQEPDAVYTSPLSRCTRLADYCGYPEALRDERVLEMNFGRWEMQSFDAIDDPRLQEWYDNYLHVAATEGESFDMQYRRVSEFLDELQEKRYRRVVMFAHGGVLICAQIYAGILRPEEAFSGLTPYGGVVRLQLTPPADSLTAK